MKILFKTQTHNSKSWKNSRVIHYKTNIYGISSCFEKCHCFSLTGIFWSFGRSFSTNFNMTYCSDIFKKNEKNI